MTKQSSIAVREFIDLTDVPITYVGQTGKFVKVNAAEDGLEFTATIPPSGITLTQDHIFVGSNLNVATDVAMSGDATIVSSGLLTLANTTVVAGTYGNATNVPQITVDSKGRATGIINVPITGYVPTSRTLTINGSTQDLSANRTWAITTTGTASRISVSGGAGLTPTIDIDATYVGQASITTLGTITTGVWTGTNIALANGGTGASLVASNGGIFYSTGAAGAILAGTATAGQMLRSGASAAPSWSTATFPATATGTGTVLRADGTNWVASTNTYPNTTTINQILYATGSNIIGSSANMTFNGSQLLITGGTLAASAPALNLTATLESTAISRGVFFTITSAGSAAFQQVGHQTILAAGYSGSNGTRAIRGDNQAAGTGTDPWVTGNANIGTYGGATATTAGTNLGVTGAANGGNLNIGIGGLAATNKNSATNIGVLGFGLNGGSTPIQIGGYFGLHSNNPTYESGALICDNGSQTSPIFLARDNGTTKFKILDLGSVVCSNAALATNATDGFLYIPTCAGTPTGAPTAQTGTVAMVFDVTNNKLYIYDGGWLGGTTPGAFT